MKRKRTQQIAETIIIYNNEEAEIRVTSAENLEKVEYIAAGRIRVEELSALKASLYYQNALLPYSLKKHE